MLIAKVGGSALKIVDPDDPIPPGWVKMTTRRPNPAHLQAATAEGGWREKLPTKETAYHQRIQRYRDECYDLMMAAAMYRLDGRQQDANAAEQEALNRYHQIKNETPYDKSTDA